MKTKEMLQVVEDFLNDIVNDLNLELVEVVYVKEGSHYYLRVFIDKEEGVFISDCEAVSRQLEAMLDEKELISSAYILEVNSAGIDRVLKKDADFDRFKGRVVDLKLYKAFNNKKEYQGELKGLFDQKIVLLIDDEEIEFLKSDVAICRLAILF